MTELSINYNKADQAADALLSEQDVKNDIFIETLVDGVRKQRLNTEKNIILMWVLSQQAQVRGYRFDGNYAWLMENRALLLHPEAGHDCTKQDCRQFNAQPGQALEYVMTGEKLSASGDVFVCSMTGAAHVCPHGNCSATVIDRNNQQAGYYCPITSRAKHSKMTSVEGYNAERPIGRDKLDKRLREEDDDMNAGNEVEDFEGFDMDDDGDHSDDLLAMDNEAPQEMFEGKLGGKKSHKKKYLEGGSELESRAETLKRIIDQAHKVSNEPPQESQELPRPAVVRRPRTVKIIAEMTADEKIALHLKDLPKKQTLARSIVKFVLDFENQCKLYAAKLDELAEKATARVNSQISKARRCLTTIECDNIFLTFMLEAMSKPPRAVPNLYFGRYTNAIMQMWITVSQSPYAREVIMRKQRPLKFDKIAFGLMYKFAGGGYTINCSLPPKVLAHFNIAAELPDLYPLLSNLQLNVVSHDPAIAAAIVPSSQLVQLRQYSLTYAEPDSKTVNEGFKLLEQCYKSIFRELALTCVQELQNGTDKRLSVQAYLDACASKKVPPTSEEPSA